MASNTIFKLHWQFSDIVDYITENPGWGCVCRLLHMPVNPKITVITKKILGICHLASHTVQFARGSLDLFFAHIVALDSPKLLMMNHAGHTVSKQYFGPKSQRLKNANFSLLCQLFLPKMFWHFWTKFRFLSQCVSVRGWSLKTQNPDEDFKLWEKFSVSHLLLSEKRRKFNFHLVLMSLRLLRFQSCFSSDILTYFCFNLWFLIQEFMPASPSNSLLWNDDPQCLKIESKILILETIEKNCRSKSIKIYEFIFIDLNYFD